MTKQPSFSIYYFNNTDKKVLLLLADLNIQFLKPTSSPTVKTLNCFVLNLISYYDKPFKIHFDNSFRRYKNDPNINPLKITSRKLRSVRNNLLKLDFIQFEKGLKGKKCSIITPTDKFRDFLQSHGITKDNKNFLLTSVLPTDPIIKKNEYSDLNINDLKLNNEFKRSLDISRKILQDYNAFLSKNHISFSSCEPTLFVKRTLSHLNLPLYGRLHGQWMNIKKEDRAKITINDNATVEKDFSACQLSILAAVTKNALPPNDAYDLGIDGKFRKAIKKAISIIINKPQDPTKDFTDSYAWLDNCDEIKALIPDCNNRPELIQTILNKIKSKYPYLVSYASSLVLGLQIMYLESEIAIGVINDFLKQGKIVLTVHDSFICEAENEIFLKDSMIKNFQEILNTQIVPIIN